MPRRRAGLPVAVSEMLVTGGDLERVLEQRAADYAMIDPTWVGASRRRRLASRAASRQVPPTMHDCTGPLTVFAGLHVCAAVPGCAYQETVRAHIRSVYPELIEPNVEIRDGHAALPSGPGLGTRLNPELFDPGDPRYERSAQGGAGPGAS